MKSHRGIRAAVALSSGVLAVLAFQGTASAAPVPPGDGWDHVWSGASGDFKVYVEEHGDLISACDTKADGKTPTVWVGPGTGETTRYSFRVTGGSGSCVSKSASLGGVYNLPEGQKFTVTACSYGCGAWPFVNDH
ncbi:MULTISPECIES: hypothetical protein [Amycolatopsis]|uniref:Uncharacterized protein n=3 Tax=Amycolatopsis TaxID=1813 RepID=A0A3N2GR68_9PSEU|nr:MULTISPECIES: hypothetical protein [Amycolatopsis]MCF6426005.1 hypothetical protein [Amycolatopsis tucumanensis]ROS39116.1 hypothetical protein EDD35_1409 [Amycolatopsis thermoflava]